MLPKFSISKNDRIYISDKFLCNGKWLVTRAVAASHIGPKALKPLLSLQHGCYHEGIAAGKTGDEKQLPDFAIIIPKRDGYIPVSRDAIGVEFRGQDSDEIRAYKFQATNPIPDAGGHNPGFIFGIANEFVPLLRLGSVFAKEATSPVIVLGGDSLNDELLAVVMPYRISEVRNV